MKIDKFDKITEYKSPGYQRFVNSDYSYMEGRQITLGWNNEYGDHKLFIKCVQNEIQALFMEAMQVISGRSASTDPDFASEIKELSYKISASLNGEKVEELVAALDGKSAFSQDCKYCSIDASIIAHPLITAKSVATQIKGKRVFCLVSQAALNRNEGETARLILTSPDERSLGFKCMDNEVNAFLGETLLRYKKKTGIALNRDELFNFMETTSLPATKKTFGETVAFYYSEYNPPKMGIELEDDKWTMGIRSEMPILSEDDLDGFLDDESSELLKMISGSQEEYSGLGMGM